MLILYNLDPFEMKGIDEAFCEEANCARSHGFSVFPFDHDEICNGSPVRAVRCIPKAEVPRKGLCRSWMLTPHEYERLYAALQDRGLQLINSPESYRHCHYLPESYEIIKDHTPETVWIPSNQLSDESIAKALARFEGSAVVIKDYVKSQKHYWNEACFIPDASNLTQAKSVIARFRELQDQCLEGGLVCRRYVPLLQIGTHPRSGMPLGLEYRIFFFEGHAVLTKPYWPEMKTDHEEVPLDRFNQIASQVKSQFFTMDVAKTESGSWLIVELGDAQVSGLPRPADAELLFQNLKSLSDENQSGLGI
ncbi:ATP-grasp domain-containing protein [Sulfidibacter corallicola]|uniref:ATP-grasp domain-containing protein n=1 Tax=Sulfidibacter corallicola TaxID=2818388 RepID=A0A8A4TGH1_SULCO|nr:ATP-grasp domain-containing protein [Sulfidibacter corallicola]QTD48272.1 ATP-grasp domain-containing protein [Sulfidibacter corallicola]